MTASTQEVQTLVTTDGCRHHCSSFCETVSYQLHMINQTMIRSLWYSPSMQDNMSDPHLIKSASRHLCILIVPTLEFKHSFDKCLFKILCCHKRRHFLALQVIVSLLYKMQIFINSVLWLVRFAHWINSTGVL